MAAVVLVAYATKLGSTREIAERIAAVIGAAGFEAEAVSVRDVHSVEPYRAVVLGSALYAAHWQRDANRFVTRHRDVLAVRPLWLFSSGPLDVRLARQDLPITPHAAGITSGLAVIAHRTFGGRLLPDAPVDPQVLATHQIGDFRDWRVIERWAAGIAAALPGLLPPAEAAQ